jgi:hypothetical protein
MKKFVSAIAVILSLVLCSSVLAQVPKTSKLASTEYMKQSALGGLIIQSLASIDVKESLSIAAAALQPRENIRVGNYYASKDISQRWWRFTAMADGRFAIRMDWDQTLCLTIPKTSVNDPTDSSGDPLRLAVTKKCNSSAEGQQFFLQPSVIVKQGASAGKQTYVIRSVDEPSICLSTHVTPKTGPDASGHLAAELCQKTGSATDRWVISNGHASTPSQLMELANNFAKQDYRDKDGKPIYIKEFKTEVDVPKLVVGKDLSYRVIPFESPLASAQITAYTNFTPIEQDLHIERFVTHTSTTTAEASAAFKLVIVDISGKMSLATADAQQKNSKIWHTVPPKSTMFFTAAAVSVSGTYKTIAHSDLGDSWSMGDVPFASEAISSVVVCTTDSEEKACRFALTGDVNKSKN